MGGEPSPPIAARWRRWRPSRTCCRRHSCRALSMPTRRALSPRQAAAAAMLARRRTRATALSPRQAAAATTMPTRRRTRATALSPRQAAAAAMLSRLRTRATALSPRQAVAATTMPTRRRTRSISLLLRQGSPATPPSSKRRDDEQVRSPLSATKLASRVLKYKNKEAQTRKKIHVLQQSLRRAKTTISTLREQLGNDTRSPRTSAPRPPPPSPVARFFDDDNRLSKRLKDTIVELCVEQNVPESRAVGVIATTLSTFVGMDYDKLPRHAKHAAEQALSEVAEAEELRTCAWLAGACRLSTFYLERMWRWKGFG